jgi:hypothetical protein
MSNRCRLIGPTQLVLERPMYGPVTETEFLLVGVREHRRALLDARLFGFVLGALFVAVVTVAIFLIRVPS